jgi:hypothetical protein
MLSMVSKARRGSVASSFAKNFANVNICHYSECCYTERHVLYTVVLNVVMQSAVILNVMSYLLLCSMSFC